jgi:hypothetical protein
MRAHPFAGGLGPLDPPDVMELPGMATSPLSSRLFQSPFRLVVKARTPIGGKKSRFVWEIIRNGREWRVVARSSVSYTSMEEPYEHGAIEIKRLRRKAQ